MKEDDGGVQVAIMLRRRLIIFTLIVAVAIGFTSTPALGASKPGRVSFTYSKKINPNTVVLKWKKVKSATGYAVYKKTTGEKKYRLIKKQKSTSFTDKKYAKYGKRSYYKIRAYKTLKETRWYNKKTKKWEKKKPIKKLRGKSKRVSVTYYGAYSAVKNFGIQTSHKCVYDCICYKPYEAVTCEKDGLSTKKCLICGKKTTKVIPRTGHRFGDWEIERQPISCTQGGNEVRRCMNKNCEKTESRDIPPLPHDFGIWETTINPTCEEDGEKMRTCKYNPSHTETEVVPATGHSFGAWAVISNATCTDGEVQKRVCETCGKTETVIGEPMGHEWTDSESNCILCGAPKSTPVDVISE